MNPKSFSFYFEIIDNDTNQIIDKALLSIKTNNYSETPIFTECTKISSNDYFEYELMDYHKEGESRFYVIQLSVYNKTDAILKYSCDNLQINDVVYPFEEKLDYNSNKAYINYDKYVFPNCINCIALIVPCSAAKDKGIKNVEKLDLDIIYESMDISGFSYTDSLTVDID